jgi:parallel beta-helix repeat protein
MNEKAFERFVAERVAGAVVSTSSGPAIERTISRASRTRQRPRWLALIKEPPMRISSRVAVGSPTARVAALLATTLLLATIGVGAVVAGGRTLLAGGDPIVVAQDGSGDFPTITEAVDAAVDGDVIMVKPGHYIETVTITEDITLAGDGPRDQVVIENPPDGPVADHEILREWGPLPQFTLFIEDADATISGLTVSGPMTGGITAIVIGGQPRLEDISIVLEGPSGTWQYYAALYILGASSAEVVESELDGYVSIDEGASPTIEDTDIANQVDIGGSADVLLRGNRFLPNTRDSYVGVILRDSTGVFEGNDLEAGALTISEGSRVEVRDNTRIAGSGISVIDQGTSATITGNTVSSNLTGIDVRAGATATIGGNSITGSAAGLTLASDAVTVEGNTITGSRTGIVVVGEATPTIIGNTLCDNETDLRVEEGNPTTLEGNEVCPESASPETAE